MARILLIVALLTAGFNSADYGVKRFWSFIDGPNPVSVIVDDGAPILNSTPTMR